MPDHHVIMQTPTKFEYQVYSVLKIFISHTEKLSSYFKESNIIVLSVGSFIWTDINLILRNSKTRLS